MTLLIPYFTIVAFMMQGCSLKVESLAFSKLILLFSRAEELLMPFMGRFSPILTGF